MNLPIRKSAPEGISENYSDYIWFDYFSAQHQAPRARGAALRRFITSDMSTLCENIGYRPLTRTLMTLLLDMIRSEESEILYDIIKQSRNISQEQDNYLAGNISSILVQINPSFFEGRELNRLNLKGFECAGDGVFYEYISLRGVNLSESDLEGANFGICDISGASLRGCNLKGVKFRETQIDDASLNPKNMHLAISSLRNIMLWDLEENRLLKNVPTHGSWNISFSPDGNNIVNSLWGGFDIRDARNLDILSSNYNSKVKSNSRSEKNNLWVSCFAFSEKNNTLFVGCNNAYIYVWDLGSKTELKAISGHKEPINKIVVSDGGDYLVSYSYSEMIFWKLSDFTLINQISFRKTQFGDVMIHPFDEKQVLATYSGKFHIIDIESQKTINSIRINEAQHMVFCSIKNENILFVSSYDHISIILLDRLKIVDKIDMKVNESVAPLDEFGFVDIRRLIYNDVKNELIVVNSSDVKFVDIETMRVVRTILNIPNVQNTSFVEAKNVDEQIVGQLKMHGAIFDDVFI